MIRRCLNCKFVFESDSHAGVEIYSPCLKCNSNASEPYHDNYKQSLIQWLEGERDRKFTEEQDAFMWNLALLKVIQHLKEQ